MAIFWTVTEWYKFAKYELTPCGTNIIEVKSAPSQNDLKMKVKIGHIFQIELIKNALILYELKFLVKRLMYNLIFIDEPFKHKYFFKIS
jgi:hypothetical protein